MRDARFSPWWRFKLFFWTLAPSPKIVPPAPEFVVLWGRILSCRRMTPSLWWWRFLRIASGERHNVPQCSFVINRIRTVQNDHQKHIMRVSKSRVQHFPSGRCHLELLGYGRLCMLPLDGRTFPSGHAMAYPRIVPVTSAVNKLVSLFRKRLK